MAEISPKLQVIISVLILVIAVVSFIAGPGILFRYSNQNVQPTSTVTPVTSSGFLQVSPSQMGNTVNTTERNMILGRWAKDPDRDDPDVLENWTFYDDGTFSEAHDTRDSTDPPSFDHGTWTYTGNSSYLVVLDTEQMDIQRTGNILTNVDDKCTFHRITP